MQFFNEPKNQRHTFDNKYTTQGILSTKSSWQPIYGVINALVTTIFGFVKSYTFSHIRPRAIPKEKSKPIIGKQIFKQDLIFIH